MTKGKLNPAESHPGDTVTIVLKGDVRSNGELIFRKGTPITGVVRNVKRADTKGKWTSQAESMMQIEWLVPATQARGVHSVSFALESVAQLKPVYVHGQNDLVSDDFNFAGGSPAAAAIARPARNSGAGLLASVGSVSGSTVGNLASSASTAASSRSNTALLSMPSVIAVDRQTSSAIESTLGGSSSGQLFQVGHGQLISASGSKQSVDFYSHLGNDTVITSSMKNFEISSGAQLQMLVGVNRK